MNPTVQPSNRIPATLHDWEHVLTKALLRADDGNVDAIRSFEITPETLAEYCGLGKEDAAAVEGAFRKALKADRGLHRCLKEGRKTIPGTEVPCCIAILALTLLVDSILDGEYEGHGYRGKLGQWLGDGASFSDLHGIATMWHQLVDWLDKRIAAGAPFRPLVLPEIPVTWTHIGYTRYLSFPTRRDLRVLTRCVERNPGLAADPVGFLRVLDPVMSGTGISVGLKRAFDDFRLALRSNAASVDHRFWRLVSRAAEAAGHGSAAPRSLTMELDEDGGRRFRIDRGGPGLSPNGISAAAALPTLLASPNLGPSIRRGVLFFRASGLASWSAAGEPPPGAGPFHLAIAERHLLLAGGSIARFEGSGIWRMTAEPIAASTVNDILRRLRIHDAKQTVRTIRLVDGVRVGGAWLGQPRFLPYFDGVAGDVEVVASTGDTEVPLRWRDGQLEASAPVTGEFTIRDRSAHWARRASFVPFASPHAVLEGAAYANPLQSEWRLGAARPVEQTFARDLSWSDQPFEHQDALEALYAASRTGIGEGEAVELAACSVGRRNWDFLRTLQESSFLEARLRRQWRGRVFTLGRPKISDVVVGAMPGFVVSGAIPKLLERDFFETVVLQGGQPFRIMSASSLAPPFLGAVGVDTMRVCASLGWDVTACPIDLKGTASMCLVETAVIGEDYRVASAWDWALGRFSLGAVDDGPVRLTRLEHPGGRDHDVYRVEGRQRRSFHSRQAAILDAHMQAGRPLFHIDDGYLRRVTNEGSLPVEVALALRMRSLTNGGGTIDGWSYEVSPADVSWLAALLPGAIGGTGPISGDNALVRRGRGARRPLWQSGGLAA